MTKLLQALLVGIFITFIADFFIFLGIFLNYIGHYNIDVYYNILFWDYQNIYILLISTIIFAIISTYIANIKFTAIAVGLLCLVSLSTLIPSVGYMVGENILMSKNITYHDDRHRFIGDVYYDGREQITFYDYELKKTILLEKKDLK